MSEAHRMFVKLLEMKSRKQIINDTTAIIEHRFDTRLRDMELYARLFYASILSSYMRADALGNKVGIFLPELEPITKALYAMSKKRSSKQGSFETSKAFEVASSLSLSYKVPTMIQGNTLTYKVTFTIDHPALVALEKGQVSWENMEKSKIVGILEAALRTYPTARNRRWRRDEEQKDDPIAKLIRAAIRSINAGSFQIKNNKRKYMEIAVKNLVKEKDFINILIK